MSLDLLVDGRVLGSRYAGVRDFWVPILRAWAARGASAGVVCTHDGAVQCLTAAGFSSFPTRLSPRHAMARLAAPSLVRASGARATLSPLYLTLTGARRTLATVFDLTGRTHPLSATSRLLWEVALRHVVRRADVVVCATAAVAEELDDAFPALRGRVRVISPIAPAPVAASSSLARRYGLSQPYAIAIGSHRPHKRLAALAAAWKRGIHEMPELPEIPLALVGTGTQRLHHPPHVQGLGWVGDDDIGSLLAGAACLVSASTAEGFGLPVLAALAQGIPVVACQQPALREVAGAAATWVEADRPDHLRGAAREAVVNPGAVAQERQLGREIAARFTAERALRELGSALDG